MLYSIEYYIPELSFSFAYFNNTDAKVYICKTRNFIKK